VIVVDSSVWIDYFRGAPSPQCDRLDELLGAEIVATGDLMLTEVLPSALASGTAGGTSS
jgi:predicted nucleic acid-binding protein